MRPLQVGLAGLKDVEAHAQVGDRDELEIGTVGRFPFGRNLGQLEGIHEPSVAGPGTDPPDRP
jgi:hypothetical protein